ncbi:MAG: hypothetical protein QM733_16560 [Ilumatobacteraceae bacterium]
MDTERFDARFARSSRSSFEALARPCSTEQDDLPAEARKAMDTFVAAGRLQQI